MSGGGYRLFRVKGKELLHELPTNQMQYNADYKEWVKKISASYTSEGMVLDSIENLVS